MRYNDFTFTGVGTAISQLSAIVSISRHFDRGRPLALGFVSTGGAVGMLSFPLLWSLVLESLEWQKGLLVVGGVAASITLASLTFSSNGKVEVGGCSEDWKQNYFMIFTLFLSF